MASDQSYKWHPLAAIGVIAVPGLLLFILWPASQVFLVIFSALLLAVLVDGVAGLATSKLPMPINIARGAVIFLLVVLLVVFLLFAGPQFSDQMAQLGERLPESFDRLREVLISWGIGWSDMAELKPDAQQIIEGVTGLFSTAFEAAINIFVIFFIGLYIAFQPELYSRGLLHLIPKKQRQRGAEIIEAMNRALSWWLVGRFASMVIVGVLTILGLWMINLPLAFVLGVLAGLGTFVPYIGTFAALIPSVLVGLTESPLMVLYVIGIYSLVQFLEGNFITPLIQRRAVSLPPAVLLSAEFFMGIFYGLFGIILATPLTVAGMVLIQMLYVQDVLNDPVRVLGQHEFGEKD